jgi:hypothetical protein
MVPASLGTSVTLPDGVLPVGTFALTVTAIADAGDAEVAPYRRSLPTAEATAFVGMLTRE